MSAHGHKLDSTRFGLSPSPLARGLCLAFICFGFLPITNWIAGGHTAPWYRVVLETWLTGTAIVAGGTIVLVVLTRRRILDVAARVAQASGNWFADKPLQSSLLLAATAAIAYAVTSQLVFDGKALFIDEIVQLYQARLFAAGRLTDPVGPYPEFFSALNVVTRGGEQFGQFPPGGPAHLTLGVFVGAPWLITPILGGCAVFVFSSLVRRVEPEPAVGLAAVLLLAFSPFMMFMAASHMNHVPTLLWVLVAWLAWSRLTNGDSALRWPLLFGFAAGVATTIRPVDGVAMTAPALVLWLLSRPRLSSALLMCLGALLPGALLLAFNNATTGSPFLFGYEALWGKTHSLGFHASPWGDAHSPARGLELLNLYALRLQSYLFESPLPSLVPIVASLALARRLTKFDQILLWSLALLSLGYFAYWHDGFYLGPRFFFLVLPAMALLAARAPRVLGDATGRIDVRRYAFVVLAISAAIGGTTGLPERARLHAQSLRNSRHALTTQVDSLGIRNALVFVRESWGSRVLARLWGRGVDRPAAEFLYRSIDTCVLDSAVSRLEQTELMGAAARAQLWPLLRDSGMVRPTTVSPDRTERVGARPYTLHCQQQVAQDHRGSGLYPIVLAAPRSSNIFARDLGDLNARLMAQHPERRAYVLLPRAAGDSLYALVPVSGAPTASRGRATDAR